MRTSRIFKRSKGLCKMDFSLLGRIPPSLFTPRNEGTTRSNEDGGVWKRFRWILALWSVWISVSNFSAIPVRCPVLFFFFIWQHLLASKKSKEISTHKKTSLFATVKLFWHRTLMWRVSIWLFPKEHSKPNNTTYSSHLICGTKN